MVKMMNNQSFIFNSTPITLVVISCHNFIFKHFIESAIVLTHGFRFPMFKSWIQFTSSLFRKFHFSFFTRRCVRYTFHSNRVTFFRTVFSSTLSNAGRNSSKRFTTYLTRFLKLINFISIAIVTSAGQRTKLLFSVLEFYLKRLITPFASKFDQWSRSHTSNYTIALRGSQ